MISGGCLCGAVRYEADAEPAWTAVCYCRDCQRSSGSGYVPVMGVLRGAMQVSGELRAFTVTAAGGGPATRHFCPACGSTVLGGLEGPPDDTMSIYCGTLDDPSLFKPAVAIFTRNRLPWECAIAGAREFEGAPG
ncbi:MAG TPA: GFA family protein [Caulobacteraceae bacterium]|jgi:hypothetical protein